MYNFGHGSCMVSFLWGCEVRKFHETYVNIFDYNFNTILDEIAPYYTFHPTPLQDN